MAMLKVDGRALYYERAGHGASVVFLHGGLIDSRLWDLQFTWFAGRADAIRFDLPGDGRSEPPLERAFSGIDCLRDVMTTLDVDRAMLVGLSGGARIALDFAISDPARVERVVAVAPGLSGYEGWDLPVDRIAAMRAAIHAGEHHRAAEAWLDLWAPVSKDELLERGRDNADSAFGGPELLDLDPPAIDRLTELHAPTLVLVGDKDVPDIRTIADLIATGAPHAEKEIFEGADHFPNIHDPARFNETVAAFLGLTV